MLSIWFRIWNPVAVPIYIYHHHHHHHIALVARISLTLSRHSSLSFIVLGRSSGQHPVSSHSCWMYLRAVFESHHQIVIYGTHVGGALPHSQRCSRCILQPQPTGLPEYRSSNLEKYTNRYKSKSNARKPRHVKVGFYYASNDHYIGEGSMWHSG